MIPKGGTIHQFILATFAATGCAPTLAAIQDRFGLVSIDEADARVTELEQKGCVHRNAGDGIVNLRLTKCDIIQYRVFKKIMTAICCSHVRL
jgi:hypothetical protein